MQLEVCVRLTKEEAKQLQTQLPKHRCVNLGFMGLGVSGFSVYSCRLRQMASGPLVQQTSALFLHPLLRVNLAGPEFQTAFGEWTGDSEGRSSEKLQGAL